MFLLLFKIILHIDTSVKLFFHTVCMFLLLLRILCILMQIKDVFVILHYTFLPLVKKIMYIVTISRSLSLYCTSVYRLFIFIM